MKLALLVALALLLGGQALAASPDAVQEAQAEALDLDGLEQAAREQSVDLAVGTGLEEGLESLLERFGSLIGGSVGRAVRSGVLLLVTAALCGLAREVGESLGQPGGLDAAALTAAVAVTAVAVSDVRSMVGLGREALDGMNQFSQVLLPTMAAAAAAGGAPSTAAARQLATVLFSDLLLTAIDEVLLPMVYAYVAVCAAHAALGNDGLKRLASLLKWGVTTALTAILLVFVGYLTVSGAIAGTADAMALKAAKMTISGMVPVVGGILSDAAGTLLAGAGE
ncbi:stage III sporulation protein AE, partial [Flavonifractor sp. An92]|uniref:stage III sporulation protein AE n=1 Tax=Flavonifractor sp. An92 TaxID=1965666 RepID=UPI000B376C75